MDYILETDNLDKKYRNFKALNKFNMHIPKGAIYGLIGKNGAGKTTIIRIITGLQQPTDGKYSLYGISSKDKNVIEKRKRISAIIESPAIYSNMSARDNLIEQYKIIGMPSVDGIDELLKLVGLENVGNKKVKYFSLGMKQRLSIAIALSSNPDFLIFDEPINGLDPQGIVDIRELILKLNREGITILISSHYLDELSKIATHYGFVDNGTIIKEISANDLKAKMKKKNEIIVSNINEAVKYFELKGIDYEVINDNTINIYGKVNISKVVLELAKTNCIVEEIIEKEETLENYYMNLIGGKEDE